MAERCSPVLRADAKPGPRATTKSLVKAGLIEFSGDRDNPVALTASGWRMLLDIAEGRRTPQLQVVDVAAQAREMYGNEAASFIAGRQLPEHDFRFEVLTITGAQITFHADATAEDIAKYLEENP